MVAVGFPGVGRAESLVVYGDKWAFTVEEPAGWHGDTETAPKFQVNVVFYPGSPESRTDDVTIRVRVGKKHDENIAEDLKADMDGYRREYPKVEFENLPISHLTYPTVASVFFWKDHFFEYVAYLNPGKEFPYILSVAMSKANSRASREELAAFDKVLQSIAFMRRAP